MTIRRALTPAANSACPPSQRPGVSNSAVEAPGLGRSAVQQRRNHRFHLHHTTTSQAITWRQLKEERHSRQAGLCRPGLRSATSGAPEAWSLRVRHRCGAAEFPNFSRCPTPSRLRSTTSTTSPHLGSTYTTIACDALARYQRLLGEKVTFVTGVDEHGQKIQRTAERQQLSPQDHCDRDQQPLPRSVESVGNFRRSLRAHHQPASPGVGGGVL